MSFNNLLDLYSLRDKTLLFKHAKSNELLPFAKSIEEFRFEIQNKYENDDHLLEVLNLLKKVFFKIAGSLLPYNKVINKDTENQIISKFMQIKKSYPELFTIVVIEIAKSFKQVIDSTNNSLYDYLCNYINSRAKPGIKVAIVTKRAISIEERFLIKDGLKSFLKESFFTENSFRKDIETFDEVVFVGNPAYFGEYVQNTFKGKTTTFISYDIFDNSINPKKIFEDIDKGVYSSIFDNVSFGEPIQKRSNITLEQADLLNNAVKKFLEEQKNTLKLNSHEAVETYIVYLENDRFLFAPKDSKIRVFTPNEKGNFIKQLNFKDIEEDDFIVIRNDRDTKLIAEVADQDVLNKNAKKYRHLQNEWKDKLRYNVKKKGIRKVSEILSDKYNISTASMASLRAWCNEDSICPTELSKILKALKYEEDKIRETHETMKKIQLAHRKAGRIISEKLMSELSNDIVKELQEKGYYTFMSKEFNGASFNIERIVSIDRSRHLIAPYNLMKPMNID
ncbi:hypothetical protein M3181_19125 [Mesobacillus maritimus]|uniref:DISARM anti-phage system protein DrmE domain-containing protein n=1 Tax=Mesobacillus maritimus TaxID=1643336 RepID=UPI00203FD434|nr:hypothetical protein [Mesobacillus maritimus]MCM3671076.1 hypothetical protein [Mesobacillus maritimus]